MKYPEIKEICRHLRKKQTPAEKLLWEVVRNRRFHGWKFSRQYPIIYETKNCNEHFFYVADFYCHEKKIVIELDGPIHAFQKEKDFNRDSLLKELGFKVIRIQNDELINMIIVKRKILDSLDSS